MCVCVCVCVCRTKTKTLVLPLYAFPTSQQQLLCSWQSSYQCNCCEQISGCGFPALNVETLRSGWKNVALFHSSRTHTRTDFLLDSVLAPLRPFPRSMRNPNTNSVDLLNESPDRIPPDPKQTKSKPH